MFSSNERISARQLGRLVYLQWTGNLCLILPVLCRILAGSGAPVLYVASVGVGFVYIGLCLRLVNPDVGNRTKGEYLKRLWEYVCFVKYMLVGILALWFATYVITDIFLPEIIWWQVMLLFAGVACYFAMCSVEIRARVCEILYGVWFVIIGIATLVMLRDISGVDANYIIFDVDYSKEVNLFQVLLLGWFMTPAELFCVQWNRCVGSKSDKYKHMWINYILPAVTGFIFMWGSIRHIGQETVWYEEKSIMTIVEYLKIVDFIPGQSWDMEGILLLCLAGNLLFGIEACIHMGIWIHTRRKCRKNENLSLQENVKLEQQKKYVVGVTIAVAMFIFTVILVNKESLLISVNEPVKKTGLEENAYVTAICIGENQKQYEVLFDFVDLNRYTQMELEQQTQYKTTGNNLRDCIKKYEEHSGLTVDYSHLQVILLQDNMEEEKKQAVITQLIQTYGMDGKTMLFETEKELEQLEEIATNAKESLGEIVYRRMKEAQVLYLYQYQAGKAIATVEIPE